MRKERLIVLALSLLLPALAWGQVKVGTAGVQFLKVGVSARAMGMAEAYLGVSDDAAALYYNPGGLLQLEEPNHVFTHIVYPAGVQFEYLGTAWPLPTLQAAVGAQVTFLHTDEMDETTILMPYGTGRTFRASDLAFGLTYAQRLTNKFSVGGSLKYIEERLAEKKASGLAFDVGTFYDTNWKSIVIAMAISNFGPDMNFVDGPFPMPINFKFGGSVRLLERDPHGVLFAFEGWHPSDNKEQFNLGIEYGFADMAFLRVGKKINGLERSSWDEYQNDSEKDPYLEYPIIDEDGVSTDGLTLGAGLKIKLPTLNLQVDYAFTNVGFLGNHHFFTLGLARGAVTPVKVTQELPAAPPPLPLPPALPDTTGQAQRRAAEERARLAAEEQLRLEAEAAARLAAEEALKAQEMADLNSFRPIYVLYNSCDLTPEGADAALFDAQLLLKYPHWNVEIQGHCDERGSNEYNMSLGERRAQTVKRYMVEAGVSEDRITTVSLGEEQPVDPGHDEQAWAKNRRIVLIVLE